MCFHASRFEARVDSRGAQVLFEAEDGSVWNRELISRGQFYLTEASRGDRLSKYHLEAAIAYWHTTDIHTPTKWGSLHRQQGRGGVENSDTVEL